MDPSLTGTGLALWDGRWDTATIVTKPAPGHVATLARLERIVDEVVRFTLGSNLVVIEVPTMGGTSGRGSHAVDRSGLFWLLVAALAARGTPVAYVVSSQRQKFATSKGNASKATVMASAIKRYADADIHNDNEADAVVLAAMGAHWLGDPAASVPQTHVVALDKVEWPPGYEKRQPSDTPLLIP